MCYIKMAYPFKELAELLYFPHLSLAVSLLPFIYLNVWRKVTFLFLKKPLFNFFIIIFVCILAMPLGMQDLSLEVWGPYHWTAREFLKWSCSVVSDSLRPLWTVAHEAPLSMGFSRQEYWSGLPFPSPGDLPNPGIKARSPALQADALTSEPPGKPLNLFLLSFNHQFYV